MNRIPMSCVGLAIACLGLSCQSSREGNAATDFRGPINASGNTSPTTVLVVPTNESDEAVEDKIRKYAEAIRRFIVERSPRRDVKVMTDAEALADGLADSAVSVYGTPQGNLWLAKHMSPVPVVIEPNRITTDRVHEGSDLRFITAWPHPSNPELGMVVYTAQRAQDVVGINGLFHGPTDFVVARGTTLLQSGNYFGKAAVWAFGSGLSLAEATEDLEFLFKTMAQVHPNVLANLSKDQYRQVKEDSRAALAGAAQDGGHVPRAVLATTAAKAAASLGDGHTSCWLTADLCEAGDVPACMPPFRLKWQAGQVVIARAIPGLERLHGARLLAIDGKPFAEAIAPVLAHISGERREFQIASFLDRQEVYWVLARPVPGPEMAVTIRRDGEEPEIVKTPLIPHERYRRELLEVRDARPGERHEFHHDGRTCYWRFDGFHDSDAARESADALFEEICERNARNLVIDLRFNGGGNSRAAEYLLDYLTSERYRFFSRVEVKVSKALRSAERLGLLDSVAGLFQGRIVSGASPWRRPRDMEHRFDGFLYVIVGPRTFSTASGFAHVVKDYRLGTLVGEETGGVRLCFGDCPSFAMPHSHLRFSVSMKRFHAPIPAPDDATRGSAPDVPITPDCLAPFTDSVDPELAFVLDLVGRNESPVR